MFLTAEFQDSQLMIHGFSVFTLIAAGSDVSGKDMQE